MWRRALLAAAALSYIICVLIMSGMQKEDLDVSMLRKLQRHNVNIDHIDNEVLRQQCFSENNGFKADTKQDKTTVPTTEQSNSKITTEIPLPVSLNMDTILNYLKRQQNSDTHIDETTTIKTTSLHQEPYTDKVTSTVELPENQPTVDMRLIRRYIELETQKKSTYKRGDDSESSKLAGTINFKTNEINPTAVKDNEYVEKLINNYLIHKQAIHTTTTEHSTKFTLDMQGIYKQIDKILAKGSNAEIIENKSVEKVTDKNRTDYPRQLITDSVPFLPLNQNNSYLERNRLLKSFYNFLSEMNQIRNDSWRSISSQPTQAQPYNLAQPFIEKQEVKYKEITTYKSKPDNEPNQKALTPNLVKEIAESVKDVIIKDLRNELSDIYFKTTHSTTESTPSPKLTTQLISLTRAPKNITQEGNASIMEKFMELYEEMKSLKQATFSLKPNKESETLELKQEIKYPGQQTLFMPIVNRLQIPDTQVVFSSKGKYNTRQSYNQDPYVPMKDNSHAVPITIQTNSVEIQPLAVPISKPQSLIRQNIIVNSVHQFQSSHNPMKFTERNRYSGIHTTQKNRTYNHIPTKIHGRYDSARYPLHVSSQDPKHREDIIRFRMRDNGNSRFDTDYYEKINFGNDHDRPYEKQISYNNRYIPRFHEKLERTDAESDRIAFVTNNDNTDKREQENNMDVPSRQQLSLVDMKKGSTYNDTHFKNFLKTQQKVTDMLERILATRPKTNTPRSVETV